MKKDTSTSADAARLRRLAERRQRERETETPLPQTEHGLRRLVHELQVHQIELEMQDEELKRTRAEAEALAEKYSDLYDCAPVGYLTLDAQGEICGANLACEDLLGVARSKLVARRFHSFLPADSLPIFTRFLDQVFLGRSKETCEVFLTCNGDTRRHAYLEGALMRAGPDAGTLCRVVAMDITLRKVQEQKILDYQRQLKALVSEQTLAEERLRSNVAMVLHDEILQRLAMAKAKVEAVASTTKERLTKTTLAVAAGMLAQTLQETRSLTTQLSYPALHVLGFVRAVEGWLHDEVEVKQGLETVFRDDVRDVALTDDVRAVLFRSVRELLVNVIKHAHATRVVVSVKQKGDCVLVVIQDNGMGCDPEQTIDAPMGFGMLSIRESLERLGGRLHVESRRGEGCTITVFGPVKH